VSRFEAKASLLARGSGPGGFLRRGRTLRGRPALRGAMGLARQRGLRGGFTGLALQGPRRGQGTFPRNLSARSAAAFCRILRGFSTRFLGRRALLGRRQLHPGPPGFRQADGDRLPGGAGAMFSGADFINFFADEFARLGGRGFALAAIRRRALDRGFLGHTTVFACRASAGLEEIRVKKNVPTSGASGTSLRGKGSNSQDTSLVGAERSNHQPRGK